MKQREWLLLIHQIASEPAYLRVKLSRRLAQIGAVPLKSTVYVLPKTDDALEDFRWTAEEITTSGGEATVCTARLLSGISDDDVEESFRRARDADYAPLLEQLRALGNEAKESDDRRQIAREVDRLRRRLGEIREIDFFGAPGGREAAALLEELSDSLEEEPSPPSVVPSDLKNRVWVTRAGVGVDRMASAWLIRRFIDPRARFRFVKPPYLPRPNEIRFDMFDAEFTHSGEHCTFETFLHRLKLRDRALGAIAQVVHDIDLKEKRFDRAETSGVAALVGGIVASVRSDQARLERAAELFETLYQHFRTKRR